MNSSPALEIQKRAGATMTEAHGWNLPARYSSLEQEYKAATGAIGLVERSHIGRLRIAGDDGLDLLDRLSTNKLQDLTVGSGMDTVLTSNKGRVLDLLFVTMLDDHLLVLTGPESRQKVADWIEFYTIMEEVEVLDVTDETAMLGLVGPTAATLLGQLSDQDVSNLSRNKSLSAGIGGIEVLAIRTDFVGLPAYDLAVSAAQVEELWALLLEAGVGLGLTPVGTEALEVVRVEQGVPVQGRELSEDVNPLEANLLDFISFNKGCYVGQEVVARLNTYDKVQRHLVGLSWALDQEPEPNSDLFADGKKVGVLTSAVTSPRLSKGIGLAYLRKAHAKPGVTVGVETATGEIPARVEELPFTQ